MRAGVLWTLFLLPLCSAQTAPYVEIKLPVGVRSETIFVRYALDADFGGWVHPLAGLGDVFIQRWGGGSYQDPLPVYGPQGVEAVVQGFNQAYSLDKIYRVAHHGEAILPPSGNGGIARPLPSWKAPTRVR